MAGRFLIGAVMLATVVYGQQNTTSLLDRKPCTTWYPLGHESQPLDQLPYTAICSPTNDGSQIIMQVAASSANTPFMSLIVTPVKKNVNRPWLGGSYEPTQAGYTVTTCNDQSQSVIKDDFSEATVFSQAWNLPVNVSAEDVICRFLIAQSDTVYWNDVIVPVVSAVGSNLVVGGASQQQQQAPTPLPSVVNANATSAAEGTKATTTAVLPNGATNAPPAAATNAPPAATTNAPPAAAKNSPPAAATNAPSAAATDAPPAAATDAPPATATHAPSAAATDAPPAAATNAPLTGATNAPPAAATKAPPAEDTNTPPTAGTNTPPAAGTNAPPAAGTNAPPAEATNAPPTGATNTPPAAATNTPPASGTNAPPAKATNAPPTRATNAPPTAVQGTTQSVLKKILGGSANNVEPTLGESTARRVEASTKAPPPTTTGIPTLVKRKDMKTLKDWKSAYWCKNSGSIFVIRPGTECTTYVQGNYAKSMTMFKPEGQFTCAGSTKFSTLICGCDWPWKFHCPADLQ